MNYAIININKCTFFKDFDLSNTFDDDFNGSSNEIIECLKLNEAKKYNDLEITQIDLSEIENIERNTSRFDNWLIVIC